MPEKDLQRQLAYQGVDYYTEKRTAVSSKITQRKKVKLYFPGLRAVKIGTGKVVGTVRERYGNGNGCDISFPDRRFPTSPVTDLCSRVSRPNAR